MIPPLIVLGGWALIMMSDLQASVHGSERIKWLLNTAFKDSVVYLIAWAATALAYQFRR